MARRGATKATAPRPDELVRVRCIEKNIWTSAGKLFVGDEAEVPFGEVEHLRGRVEIVE